MKLTSIKKTEFFVIQKNKISKIYYKTLLFHFLFKPGLSPSIHITLLPFSQNPFFLFPFSLIITPYPCCLPICQVPSYFPPIHSNTPVP